MKSTVFWDIMMCSPFKTYRRFGRTCRLSLQDSTLTTRLYIPEDNIPIHPPNKFVEWIAVVDEWWIGNGRCLIDIISWNFHGESGEATNFSQDSRCPVPDFNLAPPEYRFTSQPASSHWGSDTTFLQPRKPFAHFTASLLYASNDLLEAARPMNIVRLIVDSWSKWKLIWSTGAQENDQKSK
jgi:hypothetical protein